MGEEGRRIQGRRPSPPDLREKATAAAAWRVVEASP
jgi:hypothetical protein